MRVSLKIYRYDRKKSNKPFYQNYEVTVENKSSKVLSLLEMIKKEDPSLSFRRSCGEGVCGSDGMNINGKNALACITSIDGLKQPIVLRPLPGMPVIRDLVVDMKQFYENYEKIKPYLIAKEDSNPEKERLQSPSDRKKLDGLYECIMCGCCSSSCPSFWWNPDKFIGPAGLLQSYRFIADSRDSEKTSRLDNLKDSFSAFRCRTIMSCTSVCPKGLNPTEAIRKIKSEMIKKN